MADVEDKVFGIDDVKATFNSRTISVGNSRTDGTEVYTDIVLYNSIDGGKCQTFLKIHRIWEKEAKKVPL